MARIYSLANAYKHWKRGLELLRHGWRLPKRKPRPVTMYDSVTVSEIPDDADAVAGYVGGNWPTFSQLVALYPNAKRLSIAIAADEDAEALDVEPGDATPPQAASWLNRQRARGIARPVVYTSVSKAQALVDELTAQGQPRSSYRLWTAHYTFQPHRCSAACGFGFVGEADATQWTDKALGRNLDASLCAPGFFA